MALSCTPRKLHLRLKFRAEISKKKKKKKMLTPRLIQLFGSVMNEGNTERKLAEGEIHEIAGRTLNAFVESCMCIVAARSSVSPSIRLMSAAALKQLAAQQKLTRDAYGSQIFELLLAEESDPVANMLAAVLALSFSSLSQVFGRLQTVFEGDNTVSQQNAVKCLDELIDLLPPSATKSLCPLLANLLKLAQSAPDLLQAVTVMNVAQKLANALTLESGAPLAPILDVFAEWILESSFSSISQDDKSLELALHFQRLVGPIFDCLPQRLSTTFLMRLLEVLQSDANIFVAQADAADNSLRGKLTSRRWELIAGFYHRKNVQPCAVQIVTELAPNLFNLILLYSQPTPDLVDEWTNSPNKLLEQESDREDHVSWSTRDVVIDLSQMLVKRFPEKFIEVVMEGTQAIFTARGAVMWTLREAAMCIFQHIIDTRAKTLSKNGVSDLSGLVQMLVLEDLSSANCLVAARGVLLINSIVNASQYFNLDAANLTKQLLPACLSTMENTATNNAADVVSACSSKLLLTLTSRCDETTLLNSLDRGIPLLLCCISRSAISDDYLYLVLEVLTQWVTHGSRVGKQINWVPSCLGNAPETIVAAWKLHIQDPNVAGLMCELLDAIAEFEPCDPSMTRIFPWMGEVLCGQASAPELCIVPQILNVVTSVFNKASGTLALYAANCFADPLCQVLLCSDDTATISSACLCFVGLIGRARTVTNCSVHVSPALLHNDAASEMPKMPKLDDEQQTVSLAEALVAITCKLLSSDRSEISLLNIGCFLESVAKCGEQMSSNQLILFLSTVVQRAINVRTDTAFQQLLLPVATILCWNLEIFLSICDRTVLLLLQKWLPRQEQISEAVFAERSISALMRLLSSLPSNLANQVVRWKTDDVKGRGTTVSVQAAIFAALCKSIITLSAEYRNDEDCAPDDVETQEAVESDTIEIVESSDDDYDEEASDEVSPNQLEIRKALAQLKTLRKSVAVLGPEIQSLFSHQDVRELTAFFEAD